MFFRLERPTESIETFSKEAHGVLCTPFTGIKSSMTFSKIAALNIENTNMESNVSLLYSTSNFLSHLLIDSSKNLFLKQVFMYKNVICKTITVMNHDNPIMELGMVVDCPIAVSFSILFDKTREYKIYFLSKKNNIHFGTEISLVDKKNSIIMLRYELESIVVSLLVRQDASNMTFFKKISKTISMAGELATSGGTAGGRIGVLFRTHFTNIKIEINTLLHIVLMMEKKLLDNFIFNICVGIRDIGDTECGFGFSLEI